MKKLLLLALLALPSCVPVNVFRSYVAADRLSYNAQAISYLHYVEADPTLDSETKKAIKIRLAAEGIGIARAEEYLGLPVQPVLITLDN